MANVLLDFGDENGLSGYVGGGRRLRQREVYFAREPAPRVHIRFSDTDCRPAFQAIAGIRLAVSQNIDVGLKYRFFTPADLNFNDNL